MELTLENINQMVLTKYGNWKKGSASYSVQTCSTCANYCLVRSGTKRAHCNIGCAVSDPVVKLQRSKLHTGRKHSKKTRAIMSMNNSGHGNNFYGKKHTDESKRAMASKRKKEDNPMWKKTTWHKGRTGVYTEETYRIMSESKKGIKNPNWNHSLSKKDRVNGRNLQINKDWRFNVFTRDLFTCGCCHTIGGKLNAHHIKNYANYPNNRLDVENGITLCLDCHTKFHKEFGKKYNSKKQLYYFLLTNMEDRDGKN